VEALIGAGRAALAMGDAHAAIGFFGRAEDVTPRNGRVKAGLAACLVQQEQPREALRLFQEAVALGVSQAEIGSDRGLPMT
jgi:Flp pilus assembly protein TadD